jgi:hypothetical protein
VALAALPVTCLCLASAFLAAAPSASPATGPTLSFSTFLGSDLPLGQVIWAGDRFLYVAENLGQIESSDATGHAVTPFAAFNQGGEEMRCLPAPTKPAYWPEGIYCHTPDNRILRLSPDGSSITELAQLPSSGNSDGSLSFDTVGRFGYALLAATGGSSSDGGQVFAIRKSGKVQLVGSYPGPGGADEIAVAPAGFGVASGELLIAIDQGAVSGSVLAIDREGTLRSIANGLGNGLNPLVVIAPAPAERAAGSPAAGLYLADTTSQDVFFAPASELAPFAGSVLVGSELSGELWIIRPAAGGGFETLPVTTDLTSKLYNLEGSCYVP